MQRKSKPSDERQAADLAKLLREIADDPALADTPLPDRLRSMIGGACRLACTLDPGSRVVTGRGSHVVTGRGSHVVTAYTPTAPNVLSMTLREAHENLLRLQGALPRKGNEAARLRTLADTLQPTAKAPDGPGKEEAGKTTAELSQEALAIAALKDHPDWSDARIAKAAGCHRKSLYRWQSFKSARVAMREGKAELPRGAKSKEGEIEASWSGNLDKDYK